MISVTFNTFEITEQPSKIRTCLKKVYGYIFPLNYNIMMLFIINSINEIDLIQIKKHNLLILHNLN